MFWLRRGESAAGRGLSYDAGVGRMAEEHQTHRDTHRQNVRLRNIRQPGEEKLSQMCSAAP